MRQNQYHRITRLRNSPRRKQYRANAHTILFILFIVLCYAALV